MKAKLTLITEYETEYEDTGVPGQVYTHTCTHVCMTERFLQVSPMNITGTCKTYLE